MKSFQKFPFNADASQDYILFRTFFILYVNDLPGNPIYNIPICADDTTPCFRCDWASGLSQSLESASELESGLKTLWTG